MLFALGLVPVAYASWMLFRTPAPRIEGLTPALYRPHQADQYVQVTGRDLRPFLRASVGSVRATYLFDSPDRAQVQLPPLEPGTYDLALYDVSREIARFPKGVTVSTVQPQKVVPIRFVARFVTRPEVLEIVRRELSESVAVPSASHPVLVSYQITNELAGTSLEALREGRISVVRVVVRALAIETADGWHLEGRPLKAGAPFTLNGRTYVLQQGSILSLSIDDGAK